MRLSEFSRAGHPREVPRHGQIGGHLEAVEESGLEIETVPIIRGLAVAGGRITREAFDFFADAHQPGLKPRDPSMVLRCNFMALVRPRESTMSKAHRSICVGPSSATDIPIVLGLDHHANVTQKIIDNSTAIVGHRTQPHDPFDTGKIGTELLIRIMSEGSKPVMAWRKIPLLSHQEQFLTSRGPDENWFDRARSMEKDPRVLQASNYPMQPWLDVAEGGWSTIVVTDNDRPLQKNSPMSFRISSGRFATISRSRMRCRSMTPFGWPMQRRRESSCSATPAIRFSEVPRATAT